MTDHAPASLIQMRHRHLITIVKVGGLIGLGLLLGLYLDNLSPRATDALSPEQAVQDNTVATAALPSLAQTEQYEDQPAIIAPPPLVTKTVILGKGDTLMDIVVNAGATRRDAHSAIQTLGKLVNLRRLQVGQRLSLGFSTEPDADSETDNLRLQELTLQKDFTEKVMVSRQEGEAPRFDAQVVEINVTRETHFASGTIDDSLYLTAAQQDVPAPVIAELIRILSFDVDFQREIRQGDQFEVYYENLTSDEDGTTKAGDILYAGLTLRGTPIALYRFDSPNANRIDYYHSNGQSARRTLMRTPIDGARLTSRFGQRKHPTLGYTKMHKGIDFGAVTGTPIMAAGDGVIEMSQRNGSYGNYVRIRHNGTYKTAYAHLSRYGKGIHKGQRVKQGQIIGYVGTTGRSTGPHLHYEVLMNDQQVNPLTLKLPTGHKLDGTDLAVFQQHVSEMQEQLVALRSTVQLAQE